jgi:hypothetical protein
MLEAQPASLATRDEEDRDLSPPQGLLASALGFSVAWIETRHGNGSNPFRPVYGVTLVAARIKLAELFQVDGLQLAEQFLAFVVIQAVPPGEDVFLAVIAQSLPKISRYCYHMQTL